MLRRLRIIVLVVILALVLGGCKDMFISDEFLKIMEEDSTSMQEIWEIEDQQEFISQLSMYIGKKCDYGSNLDALSHEEKVFYITQILEMEVNNGGFWQFLYNVESDVYSNAVSAFFEIGAEKTAEVCQSAFSAFHAELPLDRSARVDFLSKTGMEKCYEILSVYDDMFCDYEEDLNELNYIYVQNHADAFS